MDNPWKVIDLDAYEGHMKLGSVMQLQVMNQMMYDQLYRHEISTVTILGIAGGNGLNHIKPDIIKKVYGVDINGDYLHQCVARYLNLQGTFTPIQADLCDAHIRLPHTDLLIANLLIEYIGYECFQNTTTTCKPQVVSCILQVNRGEGFISNSPYLQQLSLLQSVHHSVDEPGLTQSLQAIGYQPILQQEEALPNGKALLRLDYQLQS